MIRTQAGLIKAPPETDDACGIELGCGTGYLANMVADCTELRRVVLVDSGHFRKKADR